MQHVRHCFMLAAASGHFSKAGGKNRVDSVNELKNFSSSRRCSFAESDFTLMKMLFKVYWEGSIWSRCSSAWTIAPV